MPSRAPKKFKDRRRKHFHWLVTITYGDQEKFGRVYTNQDKANKFATRQSKSPLVKNATVAIVD